jgi:hypothetical protein
VKTSAPSEAQKYAVHSDGAQEYHFSPFMKKGVQRRFLPKMKYLLRWSRVSECDGQYVLNWILFGAGDDSSGEEEMGIQNLADTVIVESDFHIRLLADTATCRKLKARKLFTVPFRFLCGYTDQSEEHMDFISMKLETLKSEIAELHQTSQQVSGSAKAETGSGIASSSLPLEKSHTWVREKTHKHR